MIVAPMIYRSITGHYNFILLNPCLAFWSSRDILLLELGFLTILVAPVSRRSWSEYRPRNLVTMWLVRWALFRLMFASGVVKLQSGCPTWWGLTGKAEVVLELVLFTIGSLLITVFELVCMIKSPMQGWTH